MKCARCGGTGVEPEIQGGMVFVAVPRSVEMALDACPTLGQAKKLRDPLFWTRQYKAHPDVSHDRELLKAEAWLGSNGTRPKKDLARFVHNWLARAQESAQDG